MSNPTIGVVMPNSARPIVVEIEIYSRCNRRCAYCPVSLDPTPAVPLVMAEAVFQRIIDELAIWRFDGRVSYHFYSEPLLRKDLPALIACAKQRLPKALHVLYTNGDLLDDRRYGSLIRAGIDQIVVTRHDSDDFPTREKQIVLKPSQLVLTNRGGALGASRTKSVKCVVASELMVVTVTGDVLLCYEDSKRQDVFGNVMDQSLESIWQSPRARSVREALLQGRRSEALSACRDCDNVTHQSARSTFFAL